MRLHYLDNLRALAMLAGVLFHAALAYSPLIHPYWPPADRSQSQLVDIFAWFLHLFRMPLFFMIAGYFAAELIERRGMLGLMRNRARRILIPFAVLLVPIVMSLSWSTQWAAANVQHPSPVLQWVAQFSLQANPPQLPPSTSHLWFLYYLLWFYVLLWAMRSLLPETVWRLPERLPRWWICVAPMLLSPALASVVAPHPAPESFLPQFWAFAFFGSFFAFGTAVYRRRGWIDALSPIWLASIGVLLYGLWFALLRHATIDPSNPRAPWSLAILGAYISVLMTLACWVAGRRWLNAQSRVMRYLAGGSYWTYLLHLPLLFLAQYLLMDLSWHWSLKFAIAVFATLLLSYLSYELLIRRTELRRFVG